MRMTDRIGDNRLIRFALSKIISTKPKIKYVVSGCKWLRKILLRERATAFTEGLNRANPMYKKVLETLESASTRSGQHVVFCGVICSNLIGQ